MMQWFEFRSTNEWIKQELKERSLRVTYDEVENIVTFNTKGDAHFQKSEAIDMLRQLIKILEDE